MIICFAGKGVLCPQQQLTGFGPVGNGLFKTWIWTLNFFILANLHARTFGEFQTPTHYAAKNDATQSLKMLLKLGGNVHDRDYKNRTALQVAAELGEW